jgi:alpha-glucosidase
VRASVEEFAELAGAVAWPAWFLSNHDHPRVASRFADDRETGDRRARVAAMLTATMRGTPFVYQGEELGLPDAKIPPDRIVDVDGRDPERAPIPWQPPSVVGDGAGFTTGDPWLPLVEDAERLCVEAQDADPDSTLAFNRRLLALRSKLDVLQGGAQRSVDAAPGLFCFLRESDDERVLVALNFTSEPVPLSFRDDLGDSGVIELSTSTTRALGATGLAELELGPDEGIVMRL